MKSVRDYFLNVGSICKNGGKGKRLRKLSALDARSSIVKPPKDDTRFCQGEKGDLEWTSFIPQLQNFKLQRNQSNHQNKI